MESGKWNQDTSVSPFIYSYFTRVTTPVCESQSSEMTKTTCHSRAAPLISPIPAHCPYVTLSRHPALTPLTGVCSTTTQQGQQHHHSPSQSVSRVSKLFKKLLKFSFVMRAGARAMAVSSLCVCECAVLVRVCVL